MSSPVCSSIHPAECAPSACRWRCALEVIDELLCEPGAVSGDDADLLLDLRWHLRQGNDAEGTLRLFCELRRRLEQRHYLALFRIRRWLENHLLALVTVAPGAEPRVVPVKLAFFCVEAIRRVCLCAALEHGRALMGPRLSFAFRPAFVPQPALAEAR